MKAPLMAATRRLAFALLKQPDLSEEEITRVLGLAIADYSESGRTMARGLSVTIARAMAEFAADVQAGRAS